MELKIEQLSLVQLQKQLCAFERKYGMTSAELEKKYRQGEMGDSEEIMKWMRDYESYKVLLAEKSKMKKAVGV